MGRLKERGVVRIDIANDAVNAADYKKDEDPKLFKSEKTGRGPLAGEWRSSVEPVMTAYKLVTIQFKWWGLQSKVENFIQSTEKRLFTNFHRQLFCWTDKWHGMTMDDIRALEEESKRKLTRTEKREISRERQRWSNNNISLLFRDTSYLLYQSCKIFGNVLLKVFFKPM